MKKKTAKVITKLGRPNESGKNHAEVSSAEKGTSAGFMRKTYLVNIDHANKIDSISFWDRSTVKDTMMDAMGNYISKWEKDNGPVKLPKKRLL